MADCLLRVGFGHRIWLQSARSSRLDLVSHHMNQRTYNFIAVASLLVSVIALRVSCSQHDIDYARAVVVQPGALPLSRINEGSTSVDLEVVNSSKTNLQYFLRANMLTAM